MPPTAAKRKPQKKKPKKVSEKELVYAIAKRHHVPGWLLWGIYGAESTWGTNGDNYFGLIEPEYRMYNGKVRKPQNTADLAESADIAAELLYSLKKEHGTWAAAVDAYAPYSISHPRELSRQHGNGNFVDFPLNIPLPGLPGGLETVPGIGGIGNVIEEVGGTIGEAGIPGVSDIASGLSNVAAFFRGLGELILTPEGWARLGKIIGGAILLLWGLRIIIRESTGSDPVHTATKVAETAAAVAAVK